MIKIKAKPFLSCKTVIKKGFVRYKEQGGMFLPRKIRDLLTSMKILHTKDLQGDLLSGGQAVPPQRWACLHQGKFCGSFANFPGNVPLSTGTGKKPKMERYKWRSWQLVLQALNKTQCVHSVPSLLRDWDGDNFGKCLLTLLPGWNLGSHSLQLGSPEPDQ